MPKLSVEQARARMAKGEKKQAEEANGGEIEILAEEGQMIITADLTKPFVRTGTAKRPNGKTEEWVEIVYATTHIGRRKNRKSKGTDGTVYNVQVKITEAEPAS